MATLRNRLDVSATVHAHDGDSVMLPPNSTHEVDDKFLWNLPRGVVQRSAASVQAQKTPQNNLIAESTPASEAGQGVTSNRTNAPASVTLSVAPTAGSPVP